MNPTRFLTLKNAVIAIILLMALAMIINNMGGSSSGDQGEDFLDVTRADSLAAAAAAQKQKKDRAKTPLDKLSDEELKAEIDKALEEFWEEDYELPASFVEQVQTYLKEWTRSLPNIRKGLENRTNIGSLIAAELQKENLPPAFIYLAMHESSLDTLITSPAGARGPWQLMPVVSRHYGLNVPDNWQELPPEQDERTSPLKSTRAAIKYIKDLDEEFGSFFLAMVAYNAGENRIRREISNIEDPMNAQDFWYMYHNNLLPRQTTDYIPKTISTMIIARRMEAGL